MSNKYLRKNLIPSATVETTIYTVPEANTAVISSLRITSANVGTGTATVAVYPGGGSTPFFVLRNYVIPASSTMDVFSGVPLVMESGDVLKITSSLSDLTFYLSYLEMDRN